MTNLLTKREFEQTTFDETTPTRSQIKAVGKCGRALYEEHIRAHVEDEHRGRYLAINTKTSEYVTADRLHEVADTFQKRFGNVLFHVVRVGYPAATKHGARFAARVSHLP